MKDLTPNRSIVDQSAHRTIAEEAAHAAANFKFPKLRAIPSPPSPISDSINLNLDTPSKVKTSVGNKIMMFEGKVNNDTLEDDYYDDTAVASSAQQNDEYDDVASEPVLLKGTYQIQGVTEPVECSDALYHPDFNSTSNSSLISEVEDEEDENEIKLGNSYSIFYAAKPTGPQGSRSETPRSDISETPQSQMVSQPKKKETTFQSSTPKESRRDVNTSSANTSIENSTLPGKANENEQTSESEKRKPSPHKLTRIPFTANPEEYEAAMKGNPKVIRRSASHHQQRKSIPMDTYEPVANEGSDVEVPVPEKHLYGNGYRSSLRGSKRQAPLPPMSNGESSSKNSGVEGLEIQKVLGDLDDAIEGMSGKANTTVAMIATRYTYVTYF